jgi:asparagine synthase (glutamine-hydrolysing)
MCGICGAVSFNDREILDQSILELMSNVLVHRGPDDEGYYMDTCAMLGVRRLSIIDLATGQQPISNEERSIWIAFNGEIYNYQQIRKQLEAKGHIFATQSDTEVIVHAYEQYGQACVDLLNGMFAFAVWDANQRCLFLARDRLGIKPLYYWAGNGQIVFGSELRAVSVHPMVPREIDPVALDYFLTLEYIPGPRTIYKDIYKLQPGHFLIFQDDTLKIKQYWDIAPQAIPQDEYACEEALTELIKDSVQKRLVSDVPLGAFLSGGIDSSTVLAFMSHASSSPVKTFSIGFEDDSYNELPYARQIATSFNTEHHEQVMSPDIAVLAERLAGHLDEPLGDFSIFSTYLVSQMASQFVKVVLSGDGGDEVFGGYDTYVAQSLHDYYSRLPSGLRKKVLPLLMDLIPPQRVKKGLVNKAKRFVEGSSYPTSLQHTRWMLFMTQEDKHQLYQPAWADLRNGNEPTALLEDYFKAAYQWNYLSQQQYVDIKTYLVDNILTKVDRMSMAVSLEARVPLLDHRIVEFALNLPAHMKLERGRTKIILRKVMKEVLPQNVLTKPKQGFSIPLKHWLRGPLRPLMMDLLSPSCILRRGYFEPHTVSRWVDEHLEGRANHSHRLWALLMFELWQQKNLDQAVVQPS